MFKGKWFVAWLIVVLAILLITHAAALAQSPEAAVGERGTASAGGRGSATAAGNTYRAPVWPVAPPTLNQPLGVSGGGGSVQLAK